MRWLRKGFLLLVLLACAGSAHARQTTWLPEGGLFPAPLAGTVEAHSYVAVVSFDAEQSETLAAGMVALGEDFGLYRQTLSPSESWQLSLFADFQSQFNLDTSNQELINADYFVGLPLTWRRNVRSARLRLFHQSSHLGDEYILSGEAPPRQRVSYEALDGLIAYEPDPRWRLYGGAIWVFRKQWDALGTFGGQAGAEYRARAPTLLRGRWVAALDVKWTEAFRQEAQTRLVGGLRWQGPTPAAPTVTLAATAFHGAVPFGQFFEDNSTYYGVILYLGD